MDSLWFDLRDALRLFRRDRGYSATILLTLALAIGSTTAVFSIVNGVLLRPLAYRDPDRLVALREIWRQFSNRMPSAPMNERHFEYWREHSTSFDSLAQYLLLPGNLTGAGEATQISILRTGGSLFEVLQVHPAIGRTLTPDDERRDRRDVAVIGDRVWRQRFNADPAILGRPIVLDGKPYDVVGVLRPDFRLPQGAQLIATVDACIPLRVDVGWVGDHNDEAIGRLRTGVTPEQARAELDVLQAQVGEIATKEAHELVTLASVVTPLDESVVGGARRGLLLLLAAISAVLLIACSNLANLVLTRTLGRMREAAIRSALGAGRARLVRRALLEQAVLSACGGALGVGVAWAALRLFVRTAPIDLPRVAEVTLDARVMVFTAAASIAAGVLIAGVPAWRVAATDPQAALRSGGWTGTSDLGGVRARAALLALQVGLSVTLLVVTALLGASLVRVLRVDRGFTAERVLAVDIAMPATRYASEPVRLAAYDRLLASIQALPGVERATTTSMLPLTGGGQVNFLQREGNTSPRSEQPSANFRFVAPGFFNTIGLAILRGRSFTDAERDPVRPVPVVISEPVAQRLWPGDDPIGKRLSRGIAGEQGFEVVGVAADARLTDLERTPPLMLYVPYWWRTRASTSLLIRTAGDAAAALPDVRRAIAAIDPEFAIGRARPLERLVDASTAGRRYQTQLFTAFGLVALFIATVGVYGVTSYGLSRRRREMNIRVALGAQASQVLGLVVRQSTTPIAVGVAAGAAGALAIGTAVSNLLFGVSARDPFVIAAVVTLVASMGVAASATAARRGLSIEPAAALRDE